MGRLEYDGENIMLRPIVQLRTKRCYVAMGYTLVTLTYQCLMIRITTREDRFFVQWSEFFAKSSPTFFEGLCVFYNTIPNHSRLNGGITFRSGTVQHVDYVGD